MSELLSAQELGHFQNNLRAMRHAVTEGSTEEPDDELFRILMKQQAILLAPSVELAAEMLEMDPVVLSTNVRMWGMNKPMVEIKRGDF